MNNMPKAAGEITYADPSLKEQDAQIRLGLFLPGEEVRFDGSKRVVGVDPKGMEAVFGDDVLKVAETRVSPGEHENSYVPEYRFEGHEGYHPATAFEHPNGAPHEYGVMLVKDDRLWLTPLMDLDGQMKGFPREVTGFEGRYIEAMQSEGFDGFKAEMAEKPVAGEFAFTPADRDNPRSPVVLVGIPWMSSVSEAELEVARKGIEEAVQFQNSVERNPEAEAQAAFIMSRARRHGIIGDNVERNHDFEKNKLIPLLEQLPVMAQKGGGKSPVEGEPGAATLTEEVLNDARRAVYPDLREEYYMNDRHLVETVGYALADKSNQKLINKDEARQMVYPDLRAAYTNDMEMVGRVQQSVNVTRASQLVMDALHKQGLVTAHPENQEGFRKNMLVPMLDPEGALNDLTHDQSRPEVEQEEHGILRVRDDRLWLVPGHRRPFVLGDFVGSAGPPREVVGLDGPEMKSDWMRDIKSLKGEITGRPVMVSVWIVPSDKDNDQSPIALSKFEDISPAERDEVMAADRAIDQLIWPQADRAAAQAAAIMAHLKANQIVGADAEKNKEFETTTLTKLLDEVPMRLAGAGPSPAVPLTKDILDQARKAVYPDSREKYENDKRLVEVVGHGIVDEAKSLMGSSWVVGKMLNPDGSASDPQDRNRVIQAINAVRLSRQVMVKLGKADLIVASPERQEDFRVNTLVSMLDPDAPNTVFRQERNVREAAKALADLEKVGDAAARESSRGRRQKAGGAKALAAFSKGPADVGLLQMPIRSIER